MNKKIKNYLFLAGIILVTFIVCFYIFTWIKQYRELTAKTPIITEVVGEVKYDNLSEYVKERDLFILYICTNNEKKCRSFGRKFKNYIVEESITDTVVYFSLGTNNIENNYLSNIYKKYKHNDLVKKINNYPALLVFSGGKLVDFITANSDDILYMDDVRQFLGEYDF